MTKNFVMAIVLLGVATVASAKGTNESDFAVVKSQAKESVFKVMYQGDEKSTVKISIKNDQGELIFKELIKDTSLDRFCRINYENCVACISLFQPNAFFPK